MASAVPQQHVEYTLGVLEWLLAHADGEVMATLVSDVCGGVHELPALLRVRWYAKLLMDVEVINQHAIHTFEALCGCVADATLPATIPHAPPHLATTLAMYEGSTDEHAVKSLHTFAAHVQRALPPLAMEVRGEYDRDGWCCWSNLACPTT